MVSKAKKHLWILGVLVSVLMTAWCFPPERGGAWFLIGLAPLFLAIDSAPTWKQAFFRAWVWGFLSNSIVCWWVSWVSQQYLRLPLPIASISVFALSIFEQMPWAVMAGLRFHFQKKLGFRIPFVTPAVLVLVDMVWPKIFPNTMGNALYSSPVFSQAADLFGVWGLTFLVVATNEALAVAIETLALRSGSTVFASRSRRQIFATLALGLGLCAGFFFYGQKRLETFAGEKGAKTHRVGIVQPNMNTAEILREIADREYRTPALRATVRAYTQDRIVDNLIKLTLSLKSQSPELVIWPETAYPDTLLSPGSSFENRALTAKLQAFVKELGIPVLLGARYRINDERNNAIFLLEPSKLNEPLIYKKNLRLIFGEYVPGADFFDALKHWARDSGITHFDKGPGAMVMTSAATQAIGPMICLEGLYPAYVREIANLGASVLVNVTNDAWFGPGREPELHLQLTAFRAIENRLPLVRVTSTGHSALILPDGSVTNKTEMNTAAALVVEVPEKTTGQTFFQQTGAAQGWVLFLMLCILIAPVVLRSKIQKS